MRAVHFISAALCAVLGLGLGVYPSSAQETFRVGITAPTVNMLPLWVARDAGLFRMRGLDVEIVNTEGGSRGLAMVGQGRLEAMTVGLSATIDANTKGGDYRLIAAGANTMSFRFFGAVGPHGNLAEGQDRRRQRVRLGIGRRGDHGAPAARPLSPGRHGRRIRRHA